MAGKQKSSGERRNVRIRRATLLLLVIGACLIALLLILPPAGKRPAAPPQIEPPVAEPPAAEPPVAEPPAIEEPSGREGAGAAVRTGEVSLPKARIAVVIDDVGYNLEELQPFLSFPGPLTLSVLPDLPHSEEAARRITAAGKELLLHLPMEAADGQDPGPGAIRTGQSSREIRSLLREHFAEIPLAVGMNNHMGSRATADERVMRIVMEFLQTEQRFFLDSRTTADTVGRRTAAAYSVPYLERDVFLDNKADEQRIRESLASGLDRARTQGRAVLIGHVRNPLIVTILEQSLEKLDPGEIQLVPLSALLPESEGGS